MSHEENVLFDVLDEISYSNATVASTAISSSMPSLKCTGRGQKPAKHPSIMQLNLPGVVVKSLKDEGRGRGRGRKMSREPSIHCRPTLDSNVFGLGDGHNVPKLKVTPTNITTDASPPLNKMLASAAERIKLYDVPKRNPARKKAPIDITSDEQFPSLPSMAYAKEASTPPGVIHAEPNTNTQPSDSAVILEDLPLAAENQSETTTNHDNEHVVSNTAVAHALDSLFSSSADDQPLNNSIGVSLPIIQSTPTQGTQKLATGSAGVDDGDVELSVMEDSFHTVRIENLPLYTTQSQLEEVITPYGQVLDVTLELRISDGDEKLSANVKILLNKRSIERLADGSIAQFLASCLDGAETIFEGSHGPVKCYIK